MKPTGAWIIRLNGAKGDLEDLSSQCTSPEFVAWNESGDYYLTTPGFVSLSEPAKILEAANEIVAVMMNDGVAPLLGPGALGNI
jgi:hypothetical protein